MKEGAQTDVPATTGRRLAPDARRTQILDCATHLFGQRPFSDVSITEVAAQTGVTRGLVNHYFGDKRGLYIAVVRRLITVPNDPPLLPDGPRRARVESFFTWLLDVIEHHGRSWLVAVVGEGLGSDPEVQAVLREADDLAARRLIDVLDMPDEGPALHPSVRAFGGLVKAASQEWIVDRTLMREQVHTLLTESLLAIADLSQNRS